MTHFVNPVLTQPCRLFVRLTASLISILALSACSHMLNVPDTDPAKRINRQLQAHKAWSNLQEVQNQTGRNGSNEANANQADVLTLGDNAGLRDLINIPVLNELVTVGLENNPGLQQVVLALDIIKAQKTQTASSELPSADLNLSDSRAKDTDDSYSADITISWELDLWHKLSDQTRAAQFDILASEADLQASRDSLAASIMRSWLLASYQLQLIGIEERRLDILENNEHWVQQRYRTGLGIIEDLDSARSSTASARATIAEYRENLAQTKRALLQLVAYPHSERTPELQVAAAFPEVLLPLASLPEQDLRRRPDLQAQHATIRSAMLGANVAYKALLPSFSLQAALSDSGESLSDMLFKSPVWSLLSQITLPLFQGGQLRAAHEIAELQAEQAFWLYQETLLTAVTETEDALGLERALSRRQAHVKEALSSNQRSAEYYESKYRKGLVTILDLLQVQQQTFDLEAQHLLITFERLSNRVDLGLALGLGV